MKRLNEIGLDHSDRNLIMKEFHTVVLECLHELEERPADGLYKADIEKICARHNEAEVEHTGGGCWLGYIPVFSNGGTIALISISYDAVVLSTDGQIHQMTAAEMFSEFWEEYGDDPDKTKVFAYESVEL